MGLIDVLNGMANGPRGNSNSSGMSPITMAVIGLLAFKALKSFTGQPGAAPASGHQQLPSPGAGGLGNILAGGLGGLLGGGAAGSVLSGGLNDLLHQLQQNGHGETANSWVGNGPNRAISSDDLASALGADQINTLMAHTGLSREDLLASLSQHLPEAVNQLTPDGRLPTEQELSQSL